MTAAIADSPTSLRGARVLVVEDDPLLALDVKQTLREGGCLVLGPARFLASAMQIVRNERLDAAVLDVNLNGELSLPIADALADHDTPFVWLTSYPRALLPERHRDRPVIIKPMTGELLLDELARVAGRR